MKPIHPIPIIEVNTNDYRWLAEVYKDAKDAKRSDAQEIWGRLFNVMPRGYRPDNIDSRLIRSGGEHIKVPGVIAIENKRSILSKIDKVIYQIRSIIGSNTKIEDVSLKEVAQALKMSIKDVNFCFYLASEYCTFYRGGACEAESNIYTSIKVSGDMSIFYNYRDYPGIEKLVLDNLAAFQAQDRQYFDHNEKLLLSVQIDCLKDDLIALKVGQEIIWTDFTEQMNELKQTMNLPKKSWVQFLGTKLIDMTASGIISETVSKKIVELLAGPIATLSHAIVQLLR